MKTYLDILLFCPSVWIMFWYRIAHFFYHMRFTLIGLMIMHVIRIVYAIEIHPNAKIGKNLFIDHGIGTVIGETSIIGDNCIIYHNVTLGSVYNIKRPRTFTVQGVCKQCSAFFYVQLQPSSFSLRWAFRNVHVF